MMLTDELQHLRERDNGLAHGICFNHPFSVGFPIHTPYPQCDARSPKSVESSRLCNAPRSSGVVTGA